MDSGQSSTSSSFCKLRRSTRQQQKKETEKVKKVTTSSDSKKKVATAPVPKKSSVDPRSLLTTTTEEEVHVQGSTKGSIGGGGGGCGGRKPITRKNGSSSTAPTNSGGQGQGKRPNAADKQTKKATATAQSRIVGVTEICRLPLTTSFTETFNGRLGWKQRHYYNPVTSTPIPSKTKPTKKSKPTAAVSSSVQSPALAPPGFESLFSPPSTSEAVPIDPSFMRPRPPRVSDIIISPINTNLTDVSGSPQIVRAPVFEDDEVEGQGDHDHHHREPPPPVHDDQPHLEVNDDQEDQFNALLNRYGKLEAEDSLHVNPYQIHHTYSNTHGKASYGKSQPTNNNKKQVRFNNLVDSIKLKEQENKNKTTKRTKAPEQLSDEPIKKTKKKVTKKSKKAPKVSEEEGGKLGKALRDWIQNTNKEFASVQNFPLSVVR